MPPESPVPDRTRVSRLLIVLYLILGTVISSSEGSIPPRLSCRHHFLAGIQKNAVLPLKGEHGRSVSNVQCIMEKDKGVITTLIHSGLEEPYHLRDGGKKSVNFQISDIFYLRDLVRIADCHQQLTIEWRDPPLEAGSNFTLVSLWNNQTEFQYDPESPVTRFDFVSSLAGVRHILPATDSFERSATIQSTPLVCKQPIIDNSKCRIRGKVDIDFDLNSDWTYEFAFRTDKTDQPLMTFRSPEPEIVEVRLLSDSNWHTIHISSSSDRLWFSIDNSKRILVSQLQAKETRVKTIEINLDGEVLFIDPRDTRENCEPSTRRRISEFSTTPTALCAGCGCTILAGEYEDLPAPDCQTSDDEAYSLIRDPDRLSLLHVPNGIQVQPNGLASIRIAVAFKSDSDTGLLFFGHWQKEGIKGRIQVQFHYNTLTAVHCTYNGEEECVACQIRSSTGYGDDRWYRTALYGEGDNLTLIVNREACNLEAVSRRNNVSIAEVYSVPALVRGSSLFVGGTFYEKKQLGLYNTEFEHKYFENTREKVPSLRGCIKDLFVEGRRADLEKIYQQQMQDTLVDTSNYNAYAMQYGCNTCNPKCPEEVRCRARKPLTQQDNICDCADIEQFRNKQDGVCEAKNSTPVVLSTSFLNSQHIIIPIDTTKAVLSKIWIKLALPLAISETIQIAEFNSHRETLFRVLLDPSGLLQVQVHPHEGVYEGVGQKKLDLSDRRVHLLQLQRRTPLGTRYSARKYDLYIDGTHAVVSDLGKSGLNNISVVAAEDTQEEDSVIIHDFGLDYEYDEHAFLLHHSNRLHDFDVHSKLLGYQFIYPSMLKTGNLDPSLWVRPLTAAEIGTDDGSVWEDRRDGAAQAEDMTSSPHGGIVNYTPDIFEPEQLLSSRWIIYSAILTLFLCLLILIIILCYCIFCRGHRRTSRRDSRASDREKILRDSPDYQPVKMRPTSIGQHSYDDGDSSIGTDDTDLQAYRDIPSHRVKIYRESMVSILVPQSEQASDAAIIRRESIPRSLSTHSTNIPGPESGTLRSPESPAPLVSLREEQ